MALPEQEQREVETRARDLILSDFRDDYQEIYAYAVTVLDLAPDQANNEIRAALNHISRVLDAESYDGALKDLEKAHGHFDRAQRDCLKLASIHLHEQLKSDFLHIEMAEGAMPMGLRVRLSDYENRGANAREAEANGLDGVLDLYGDLFAELKRFREDVHKQFTVPTKKLNWSQRTVLRLRRQVSILIIGIIIGALGRMISSIALHWLLPLQFP